LQIRAAKQKAIAAMDDANDEMIADFLKSTNFVPPSLSARFKSE